MPELGFSQLAAASGQGEERQLGDDRQGGVRRRLEQALALHMKHRVKSIQECQRVGEVVVV